MKWIWQHPNWPNFKYAEASFSSRNTEFRINSERLMGRIEVLPEHYQQDAAIDLMLSEAIKTHAIEGEFLDRESVRSSLLSLMTSNSLPNAVDQKSAGAASLLIDMRKNWALPLTHELLAKWQSMAAPEQLYNPITRGKYRNSLEPMQIISGPYGKERIHYEAPPSAQVHEEMEQFINWYNLTNPLNNDGRTPEIVRAGIAHLWFESIHPFDDGNGRVGRAIADHALSQYLGYPTTACLSTAIAGDKKNYYLQLERASQEDLDINEWLDYFSNTVILAQDMAREKVDFVLAKTRFYDAYADQLNERQKKLVARIFLEGIKGFEGGISTKKYESITKCPNRTASRDLANLVTKGILKPLEGGGRTTRYELTTVEKSSFINFKVMQNSDDKN